MFAHGSGSSRLSPRNQLVADSMRKAGFGTLLFDLLTSEEDWSFQGRFDFDLLTRRLVGASRWLLSKMDENVSLGIFGASTGAAAALRASIECEGVRAIVSRGGRPDLVRDSLEKLRVPTLLIVGDRDEEVLGLNRFAIGRMTACGAKELAIVRGASHLFEEAGKLEEVSRLATGWFRRFLV